MDININIINIEDIEYIKSIKQDNIKALILGVDKGSAFSHSKGMESAKGEYLITNSGTI